VITALLPLISSVVTGVLDVFILDKKKKEEIRLKMLEAVNSYNSNALDSAKLRTEYETLRNKISQRSDPEKPHQ